MSAETKQIVLSWLGDLRFEGGEPGGPTTLVDGDNRKAPGPMLTLLLAAASCSGADVVSILDKMRISVRAFRIEASGTRHEQEPRRYVALHLVYYLDGEGLDQTKARRAIDLSIQKYCSVMHSLAPDIPITYDLKLLAK